VSDWPAAQHLAELYDALYSSLGEGAPRASNDAFVVRLHEASRTFGTLALEVRGDDEVTRDSLVSALIDNSLAEDPTGALTLYALAMVIGPRLLVTLRDYLDVEADEGRRKVLSHGSDLVVREIWAVGATVAAFEPLDDPAWAHAARALVDVLDGAGMAESLGHRL
jgi:hypothetical protein